MIANPYFWMAILPILPGAALGNALRPPGLSRRPARFLRLRMALVLWSLAVVPVIVAAGSIGVGALQPLLQGPVLIGALLSLLLSVLAGRVRLIGCVLLCLSVMGALASSLVVRAYPVIAGEPLGQMLVTPAGSSSVRVLLNGESIGTLQGESALPVVEQMRVDPRLFVAPRLHGYRLAGAAGLETAFVGDPQLSGETVRLPLVGIPGRLINVAPGVFFRADIALPAERPVPGVPADIGVSPDGRRVVLR